MTVFAFLSSRLISLFFLVLLGASAWAEHAAPPGTTRVARWKDDKEGAFVLEFDDGIPNHLSIVIPELQKRGFSATFFLNPGKGEYQALRTQWEKAPESGVAVLGDHTMTHQGVKDAANAEEEIGKAADIVRAIPPAGQAPADPPPPRLISFALPGVAPGHWNIGKDDFVRILAEHNLIDRGDFAGHGAMVHVQTADEMVSLADKALGADNFEYIVFHSIGPGTIPTPLPVFLDFLDKLGTRKDRLWIVDHASAYKYRAERLTAEASVLEAGDERIKIGLTSSADAALYDQPLTLFTQVPASAPRWKVAQGARTAVVAAVDGTIRYEAVPGPEPIVIEPVR